MLKVKDIIRKLQAMPQDAEVSVFAKGEIYPTLEIKEVEGVVEIGCGWKELFSE